MWRRTLVAAMVIPLSGCLAAGGPVSCGPARTSQASLEAAAAITPSDVWAVGSFQNMEPSRLLMEHWDGQTWTAIPAPVGIWDQGADLFAVSAADSRDVWAVGEGHANGRNGTLIEHWNGNDWSVVDSPDLGYTDGRLLGVAAVAANDAWAVGDYFDGKQTLALIEHWDGTRWTVINAPSSAHGDDELWSVSAIDAKDVWAVGLQGQRGSTGPLPLVEHWDGVAWRVVATSTPASAELTSVSAVSSNDVWAAGTHLAPPAPLVEHWDGVSWTVMPSPHVTNVQLRSVAATGPADVWIAGADTQDWLLEHWDGAAWTRTSGAKGSIGVVNAVVADPRGSGPPASVTPARVDLPGLWSSAGMANRGTRCTFLTMDPKLSRRRLARRTGRGR